MTNFAGVKAALISGNELVTIQRDDKPGLQYAGLWDLPGGGREGSETPFQCIAREIQEELGLTIQERNIVWQKTYPSLKSSGELACFMAITIAPSDIHAITFGDEGRGWKLMSLEAFLTSPAVVAPLQMRLRDYLDNKRRAMEEI